MFLKLLASILLAVSLSSHGSEPSGEFYEGGVWHYEKSPDRISGGVISTAMILSANQLDLDFPYSGKQRAMLTIRSHPRFGLDAIVSIQRGQIVCPYRGCSLDVSFGGIVKQLKMNKPSDGSSELLFFDDAKYFLKCIQDADRVAIEINAYSNGSQALIFDVPGLVLK